MREELPEQLMAIRNIDPGATVLELGGNIGRNTMVIASMLSNDRRLVTVESYDPIAKQLEENRDADGFRFHIVNAAISKVPVIQNECWVSRTKNGDHLPQGFKNLRTITWTQLKDKFRNLSLTRSSATAY